MEWPVGNEVFRRSLGVDVVAASTVDFQPAICFAASNCGDYLGGGSVACRAVDNIEKPAR